MVTDMVRAAIEKTYTGRMTLYESVNKQNEDTKITEKIKEIVAEDVPCRVSYKNISTVSEQDGAYKAVQEIKLFCSPDVNVTEGTTLVITQNGATNTYEKSGTPAMYTYHQEIILSLVEEWV